MNLETTLFVIFLVLKLTGAIAWSWWWVTSPLWLPFVIVFIAPVIFMVVIAAIASFVFMVKALIRIVLKQF